MNSLLTLSLLAAAASAVSITKSTAPTIRGDDRFPYASGMGPAINGASVNSLGELFAVNQTRFMSLRTGDIDPIKPLIIGPTDGSVSFTDSRFTSTGPLIADAASHSVWQIGPPPPNAGSGAPSSTTTTNGGLKPRATCRGTELRQASKFKRAADLQSPSLEKRAHNPLFVQTEMIQPNAMALHGNEHYVYLGGGTNPATTSAGQNGDLWYYDIVSKKLTEVSSDLLKAAGIHRVDSLEVSNNDKYLYVASGETKDSSISASKIFRFEIDATTYAPVNPKLVLDIFPALSAIGVDAKGQGMEAAGMRSDVDGSLFIALNRGKAMLKWKVEDSAANAELVVLATVAFPVSLELGGDEGKTLYVVGRCDDGKKACVDVYNHDVPGRAWANLNAKNPQSSHDDATPPSKHYHPILDAWVDVVAAAFDKWYTSP